MHYLLVNAQDAETHPIPSNATSLSSLRPPLAICRPRRLTTPSSPPPSLSLSPFFVVFVAFVPAVVPFAVVVLAFA